MLTSVRLALTLLASATLLVTSLGLCCTDDCCGEPEVRPCGSVRLNLEGSGWVEGPVVTWSLGGKVVAVLDCSQLPPESEPYVGCSIVEGGDGSWSVVEWYGEGYRLSAWIDLGGMDPPPDTAQVEVQWPGEEAQIHELAVEEELDDADSNGCSSAICHGGAVNLRRDED